MTRPARSLILPALVTLAALVGQPLSAEGPAPRVVEVVAKRFQFTPSEVTLKKGEPVTFRFRSEDVKHGFLLKKLKLDVDIDPGKVAEATITPTEAGVFTARCDHFCGEGHRNMKMKIIVE